MKKKEMTRLINFVMLAEKSDPRITADKVSFDSCDYSVLTSVTRIEELTGEKNRVENMRGGDKGREEI